MDSTPRPHRPRPTPHPRVRPVDLPDGEPSLPSAHSASSEAPQPIRVPSLLATLRRSSAASASGSTVGVARGASVGAIAVGAALFVVASLASPVVAENVADKKPAPNVTTADAGSSTPIAPSTTAPAPVAAAEKTESPAKAPADPGAISRLAANGIPKVALNAYRVAAARVNHSESGCGIHWSLLAGIGRAESDHGRFAGSSLRADGTSTPPIVGPALTGQTWEYFPASPEYIRVTGDKKYAHALGPMQFIPSTWQGYGADANGDGKADIFNVNDAALAAARYLCAAGGDLTTQAGRVRAVLAYNHNDQYLAQVLALADAYKRGVPVSGIPVGNTTGSLPKVGRTGSLPPVNPGAPTAADKDSKDHKAKSKGKSKGGTKSGAKGGASSTAPAKGSGGKPGSGSSAGGGKGSGTGGGSGNSGGGSGGGSGSGGGNGSGGGSGSGGSVSTPPSTTPPSSSDPSPQPTKVCNELEKLAEKFLPKDQRVCAP